MTIKHRAIQLTLKEDPIGFDYYGWNDSVVVASAGSISFNRIADSGTPSQIFYYDQAPTLHSIRVQQNENALLATIYDRAVTLWDPKHAVAPMIHTIASSKGCITDCQWSRNDRNIFSLTHSGMISTWDLRCLSRPAQKLVLRKRSHKMEWSAVDPHLLAVASEQKYVLLWDTRMIPNSSNCESSETRDAYMLLEPEHGVSDFTWAADGAAWRQTGQCCPFLWTVSASAVELHHISRIQSVFDATLEISHENKTFRNNPKVLAQQAGHGLMLMHEEVNQHNESTTKLTYLDTRHHQSIESETVVASTSSHLLGGQWRTSAQGSYTTADAFHRSFVAFSSKGLLHIVDWTKRKHSNSWDEKSLLSKAKGTVGPSLESFMINNQHQSTSFQSHVARHHKPIKRITSVLAMPTANEKSETVQPNANGTLSVRTVVGPKTFLLLIKKDLEALDNAIRFNAVEGVRVASIDQFSRQLVLEVLIPTADNGTINNFNVGFHNHFRKEELTEFYLKGAIGKTVEMVITFPIKSSHFWITPKVTLENKSRAALDTHTLNNIASDMCNLMRNRAIGKSLVHQRKHHTEGNQEPTLVQLAKMTTKRIISAWQRKTESFSIGSFKQIQDQLSAVLCPAAAPKEPENIESVYLQYVETKAFSVPFPVVSAGMFNAKGELILFGNAQVTIRNTTARNPCDAVSNIPCVAYPDGEGSEECEDNRQSKSHKSFANVMVSQYIKKAASEGMLADGTTNNLNTDSKPAPTIPPLVKEGATMKSMDSLRSSTSGRWSEEDDSAQSTSSIVVSDTPETPLTSEESADVGLQLDEDEDYQPGIDFEEKLAESDKHKRRNSKVGSNNNRRRVSYNDVSAMVSDSQKPSELPNTTSGAFSEDTRRVLSPVEFTVYASPMQADTLLQSLYNNGPIKLNDWSQQLSQRVTACHLNSQMVAELSPASKGLIQYWNLLSVAVQVSAVKDQGGLISWNHSALGKSLFGKLMQYLVSAADGATWAVTLSIVGGSKRLLSLLSAEDKKSCFALLEDRMNTGISGSLTTKLFLYLNNILYTYALSVQRSGDFNRGLVLMNHLATREELIEFRVPATLPVHVAVDVPEEYVLDVCCIFCNGEIRNRKDKHYFTALNGGVEASSSSSSSSAVRSGQSQKKGKVHGHSSPMPNTSVSTAGSPWCLACNTFGVYCAVCLLPVRDVAVVCLLCGHGGHHQHLQKWFQQHSECPTGCGCDCRSSNAQKNVDEEMIQFEDDDSEYLALSPDRTFGSNSNNNIAAYHNNNAIGNLLGKQTSASIFRTMSVRVSQLDYLAGTDIGSVFNFADSLFLDES